MQVKSLKIAGLIYFTRLVSPQRVLRKLVIIKNLLTRSKMKILYNLSNRQLMMQNGGSSGRSETDQKRRMIKFHKHYLKNFPNGNQR